MNHLTMHAKATKAFTELPVPQVTPREIVTSACKSAFHIGIADVSVLQWISKHRSSKVFLSDLLAALVVASLMLPQALAYAILAGVDPIYGLYSSIFPTIAFGLITTSSQISPGPNAPSAILMQGMVASLTSAPLRSVEFTRQTNAFGFVVGLVLVVLSIFRFGLIAQLLSWPVMSGFTSGAAITIIASQLQPFFGVTVPKEDSTLLKIVRVIEHLDTTKYQTVLLAIACLLVIMYAKKVKVRNYKLPAQTPVSLIVVLLCILLSYTIDFKAKGIAVIGSVPSNLPTPSAPPFNNISEIGTMLPLAALMGIINYVQTISVELFLAKKVGETVNPTTELLALGASGIIGSCFSSHAICGGFTRSAVQNQAGAKTPMAIVLTGVIMLICTVAISNIFSYIPAATLAAMIIAAAVQLINVAELRNMWRNNKSDFLQSIITSIFVVVLSLEKGIMAGVAMSLVLVLYRAVTPRFTVLGRLPGTSTWVATYRYPQAAIQAGVAVVRLDGELNFANIQRMTSELLKIAANEPHPGDTHPTPVTQLRPQPKPAARDVYALAYANDASEDEKSESKNVCAAIIVDGARIVAIDGTACRELKDTVDTLAKRQVRMFFVGLPGPVRDMMENYKLEAPKAAPNPFMLRFLSIDACIAYMHEQDMQDHTEHASVEVSTENVVIASLTPLAVEPGTPCAGLPADRVTGLQA